MRCLVEDSDVLGECPTWDDRAGRLVWIDVVGKRMSSCGADGSGLRRHALPDIPGSFALRSGTGHVMAFRKRLALVDGEGREAAVALPPGWDGERERFNDGACDALGRFWFGTMHRRLTDPVGALYRLDADLSAHRLDEGFGLSNGIAWSPDNRTMYHCDSAPPVIYVLDFDLQSGTVANRRPFARFAAGDGVPDGCATDREGHLWVAVPGAGAVLRYDPTGRLQRTVPAPVENPSSVAFGGADLRTLFVTTIGKTGAPDSAGRDGAVFAFKTEVPGLPQHRFAG